MCVSFVGEVQKSSASGASAKEKEKGGMENQFEKQKKEYDAHRLYVKIHFDDAEIFFVMITVIHSITLVRIPIRKIITVLKKKEMIMTPILLVPE